MSDHNLAGRKGRNKPKVNGVFRSRLCRGLLNDVPGGFVSGDRVFVRDCDTGKEWYCDVEGSSYGDCLEVGDNGVVWGEGEGGVWIHKRQPNLDEAAWEVVTMEVGRMEQLFNRNVTRLHKRLKPVLLPDKYQKLFQDRDTERVAKEKASEEAAYKKSANEKADAAITEMRVSLARLVQEAEESSQAMRVRHQEEIAKEQIEKDSALAEAKRLRIVSDMATKMTKSVEEANAIALNQAKNNSANIQRVRDELATALERREDELLKAQAHIDTLKKEYGERVIDEKERRDLEDRHDRTFHVEKHVEEYVDLELESELPAVYNDLRWHVDNTASWAGSEEAGYSTCWLSQAYQSLLEYRTKK